MPKTEFDYYYGVEAEQFTFVRVPKVLFTDKEHFGGLSNEAKLLYGLLLERMSLSRKNNWIDKHNRVYIIFLPVEEIEEVVFRIRTMADYQLNCLQAVMSLIRIPVRSVAEALLILCGLRTST